jgi:hypothetical protein
MTIEHIFQDRDDTLMVTLSKVVGTTVSTLDISGYSFYFSVKRNMSDVITLIYKRNLEAGGSDDEIKITNAASGMLEIYISAEDTKDITLDNGWLDLALKTETGKRRQAIDPQRFSIRAVPSNNL